MRTYPWAIQARRLTVTGAMLLSLAACGGSESAPTVGDSGVQPTAAAVQSVTTAPAVTTAPQATAATNAEPTTTAATVGDVVLEEATFAHGLTESYEPVNPGNEFKPEETVYLALRFKGRPEKGVVKTTFYLEDQKITEVSKDLADVNSGVIFSIGQSTYMGINLTPTQPFPASDQYRAEVFVDSTKIGQYSFAVVGEGSVTNNTTDTTSAATTTAQTSDSGNTTAAFGELQTYTYKNDLFTIDLPTKWTTENIDAPGTAFLTSLDPEGTAGVIVTVTSDTEDMNVAAQTEFLRAFLQTSYGAKPDFKLGDPETQKDGSIYIPISFTEQSINVHADSYVWKPGDKVAVMLAFGPDDRYSELWENGLSTIVNSCRVDATAKLPE